MVEMFVAEHTPPFSSHVSKESVIWPFTCRTARNKPVHQFNKRCNLPPTLSALKQTLQVDP
jgi:hypothetical protein